MRKLINAYPNISRLILAALLLALSVIGGGAIPHIPFLSSYFNMGAIFAVLVTWFMYRTENKNLNALGFTFHKKNISFLPAGFLLGAAAFFIGFCLRRFVTGETWNVNNSINYTAIWHALYWGLQAAAVQEFLIRGYCFKKLVEMSNQATAIIICGLAFIAMHDFWNGNLMQMLAYALTLFIGHLMFCEGLLKSGTIWFAIGIHWGNNIANANLFTSGPADTSVIFTTAHSGNLNYQQFWLLFLLANFGFIMLTFLTWRWKAKERPALLQ